MGSSTGPCSLIGLIRARILIRAPRPDYIGVSGSAFSAEFLKTDGGDSPHEPQHKVTGASTLPGLQLPCIYVSGPPAEPSAAGSGASPTCVHQHVRAGHVAEGLLDVHVHHLRVRHQLREDPGGAVPPEEEVAHRHARGGDGREDVGVEGRRPAQHDVAAPQVPRHGELPPRPRVAEPRGPRRAGARGRRRGPAGGGGGGGQDALEGAAGAAEGSVPRVEALAGPPAAARGGNAELDGDGDAALRAVAGGVLGQEGLAGLGRVVHRARGDLPLRGEGLPHPDRCADGGVVGPVLVGRAGPEVAVAPRRKPNSAARFAAKARTGGPGDTHGN